MKFNTPFDRVRPSEESFLEPSLTVPEQALSIQELFRRAAQGYPLDALVSVNPDDLNDHDFGDEDPLDDADDIVDYYEQQLLEDAYESNLRSTDAKPDATNDPSASVGDEERSDEETE